MYYAMKIHQGVATRTGRMTRNIDTAIRAAKRKAGYVEQYGVGVVWTPRQGLVLH